MTGDPNKKSARSFQCRDVLWETFEQMAKELECSIDYLVNEAMKQYARQRSYGGATRTPLPGGGPPSSGSPAVPPSMPAAQRPSAAPPPPPPAKPRPSFPPQPAGARPPLPPPPGAAPLAPPGRMPLPPPGARPAPPPMPMAAPPMPMAAPPMPAAPPPMPGYGAPAARASAPPPLPGGMRAPGPPAQPSAARALVALYQGERTPVTKDRFIIGRGKQTSDLTIKDPNVSRQHAMVEFLNGQYYMVDMGSTNGVEYMGQRIARKVIVEGDSYRICDHEVRFTYQ